MSTYSPKGFKKFFHNARRALAKWWFKVNDPVVIAITGSQGKTNTTAILSTLFPDALVTDKNLDTIYNVPITTLKLRPKHKLAIFELGIDRVGEMSQHLDIVQPNISIITGIAPVHSDAAHLGSLENIITEKRKIIEQLTPSDFAILNYDDPNVRDMAQFTKAQIIYYGTGLTAKENCHVWSAASIYTDPIEGVSITPQGTSFEFSYQEITQLLQLQLIGAHHVSNILAAFACYATIRIFFANTINAKVTATTAELMSDFAKLVESITPLNGRMNIEAGPRDTLILNDSLRSNPASAKAGLLTLKALAVKETPNLKKIAVLGEMGELGELEEIKHKELGEFIASLNLDLVVGIGPLQEITLNSAAAKGLPPEKLFYANNVGEAATVLAETVAPGDLIYLKGSLLRHLERISMILEGNEVGCQVISCPFYNHCSKCKYLKTGYNGAKG